MLHLAQVHVESSRGHGSIARVVDDWPTWSQIVETLLLRAGYNTNIVIIGTTLLGLAAGVVGVFALLRKRSLMADALSHATLPGICLAFLAAVVLGADGRSLPLLLLGAAATGVVGVVCIQALLRHTRLHEDAAIGIVLSVFFGVGVVLLSYIQKNASTTAAGLDKFIYGQTAAMRVSDAALMGAIALIGVAATWLFLKEFALVCFNDEFAQVTGYPVSLVDLVMMALVVIVTVAGLQAVGLILVVAMLIIPPVAARFWTERLGMLVALAALIGALSGYLGAVVSALLPRKPAGAVIVLTAGAVFALSMLLAPTRGVIAAALRRLRLRLRIARDHVLELAYEKSQGSGDGAVLSRDDIDRLAALRAWQPGLRTLVFLSLRRRGQARIVAGAIEPTEAGLARGAQVRRNHRLWEQYLISYADIAPSHVDWSVDQVEHVLSGALVAELEEALAERGIRFVPAGFGKGVGDGV